MKTTAIARIGAHPLDEYLRTDRLPHIWCPGCGLGMILGTVLRAIDKSRLDIDRTTIVSGIGCTGRAAGYVKLDSFHVTHGRALPFATGLKLANPNLKVVVFSGDGDLAAIGGNHLIHAARRNIDMTVICVNNFIYGMTGGQLGPTTPEMGRTTTSRKGNTEKPFNIPYLVGAAGATYVARWTTAHVRQMERTFIEALQKKGFSLVEVISPCPTYYGRMNEQATGLDQMRYYRYNSVVKHFANLADVDISLDGQIIVGKFIDIDRPYLPAPKGENGK
ncbi:MAG: thiamine pyrophosphate-dependent enzyme [Dehalococcoidales bacterium]|nr:thiamine pyrophosphate-dependent enzyme [Dehalococcoidales bacterium]